MKKLLIAICILFSGMAGTVRGEPPAGPFRLSGQVGVYAFDRDQPDDAAFIGSLGLEYAFDPHWAGELVVGASRFEQKAGKSEDSFLFRLDGLYHLWVREGFQPYLAGGMGYWDGGHQEESPAVNYGGGLKYFVSEQLALRGDLRHFYLPEHSDHNFACTVGLSYQWGSRPKGPVRSVPPAAVPSAPPESLESEELPSAPMPEPSPPETEPPPLESEELPSGPVPGPSPPETEPPPPESAVADTALPAPSDPADQPATAQPAQSPADQPATVGPDQSLEALLLHPRDGGLEIRLVTDPPIRDFSTFVLRQPARLVVDLPGRWGYDTQPRFDVQHPRLARIRIGQHPDHLRLVFDIKNGDRLSPVIEKSPQGLNFYIPNHS